MSLLDLRSEAADQLQTMLELQSGIVGLKDAMLSQYNFCMDCVWRNKFGLTPQQVCEVFGTSAAKLFTLGGLLKFVLNQIEPGIAAEMPANYDVQFHEDGSVTISEITE